MHLHSLTMTSFRNGSLKPPLETDLETVIIPCLKLINIPSCCLKLKSLKINCSSLQLIQPSVEIISLGHNKILFGEGSLFIYYLTYKLSYCSSIKIMVEDRIITPVIGGRL
ncbi:hypothetical protein S245_039426 [Arachis hypogaea]